MNEVRVVGRLMASELTAAELAGIGGAVGGIGDQDYETSTNTAYSYFPDGTLADCEMPD